MQQRVGFNSSPNVDVKKELVTLTSRLRNLDPSDHLKAHLIADSILCEALVLLDQRELVEVWSTIRGNIGFGYE